MCFEETAVAESSPTPRSSAMIQSRLGREEEAAAAAGSRLARRSGIACTIGAAEEAALPPPAPTDAGGADASGADASGADAAAAGLRAAAAALEAALGCPPNRLHLLLASRRWADGEMALPPRCHAALPPRCRHVAETLPPSRIAARCEARRVPRME